VWSGETVRLGLLTSELGRVIDVAAGDIKPVPDFGTRIQSEYLRGVGDIDGRFVLFLDTERLLSPAELLRLTTVDDSQPLAADTSKRDGATGGGAARPAGR
jgi:purine-binding chemotaxis protein CheW